MTNNPKAKLKTLYVMRILQDETDAEHGLPLREIIERFGDYGIQAERKGLYSDIQTLREFGLDIQTFQRNPVQYAIVRRDFTLSELMLLVDAVESCKFLTKRQSRALTTNLKLLASDHERALLDRRIHVPGRITSKNDSVFGCIDILHEAMRRRLKVSDECATRNEQVAHHTHEGDDHESFGCFAGDPMTATLLVDADKIEIILDRFGETAEIFAKGKDTGKAVAKTHKSPQLFGWIAGMDGAVKIDGPQSLKKEYNEYLRSLIEE